MSIMRLLCDYYANIVLFMWYHCACSVLLLWHYDVFMMWLLCIVILWILC